MTMTSSASRACSQMISQSSVRSGPGCPTARHRTTGAGRPQRPDRLPARRPRHRPRPLRLPTRPSPGRRRPAAATGRTRPRPSPLPAGSPAGPGLAALRMLAALADLGCDLGRELVVAASVAGVLEPLVLLEADDHRRRSPVVSQDRFLPPYPARPTTSPRCSRASLIGISLIPRIVQLGGYVSSMTAGPAGQSADAGSARPAWDDQPSSASDQMTLQFAYLDRYRDPLAIEIS